MIVNKYKGNGGGGGDMSNYYTKAQTNALVSGATEDLASEEYVDEALSGLTEDIPTAQDGSDVKQYVYQTTDTASSAVTKNVITHIKIATDNGISTKARRKYLTLQYWDSVKSNKTVDLYLETGNNNVVGEKTLRDSAIINSAEQALLGFDEEITLTLGDASEVDYVVGKLNGQSNQTAYLYGTDDDRYEVLPLSGFTTSDNISTFNFGENTLYPFNCEGNCVVGSKYQLDINRGDFTSNLKLYYIAGQDNYLIFDRELNTLSVTDSLTFTRTKSIAHAIS
jgi:hypothetical protein